MHNADEDGPSRSAAADFAHGVSWAGDTEDVLVYGSAKDAAGRFIGMKNGVEVSASEEDLERLLLLVKRMTLRAAKGEC